jgi:hypothetical protein
MEMPALQAALEGYQDRCEQEIVASGTTARFVTEFSIIRRVRVVMEEEFIHTLSTWVDEEAQVQGGRNSSNPRDV